MLYAETSRWLECWKCQKIRGQHAHNEMKRERKQLPKTELTSLCPLRCGGRGVVSREKDSETSCVHRDVVLLMCYHGCSFSILWAGLKTLTCLFSFQKSNGRSVFWVTVLLKISHLCDRGRHLNSIRFSQLVASKEGTASDIGHVVHLECEKRSFLWL